MRTRETRKHHLQVELLEGRFALSGGAILAPNVMPPPMGGVVLAPNARPSGYSLTDMARETALFLTSGNNPDYYPDTPLQVLYFDPKTVQFTSTPDGDFVETGSNSFRISPGTSFYVPLVYADDSTPIVGKFPTDASGAAGYFFGPDQAGVRGTEIIVDGKSTPIGAAYLAGPVNTPPLLDAQPPPPNGTPGTHIIELAAFLSPMSPGTHTVVTKGTLAGTAFQETYGVNSLSEDFTYTVQVG